MAKFSDVNLTYAGTAATTPVVMFAIKTQAKLAGWTVPRSSDGTTYNSTGDQITTAASGAGGLANTGAWYIIRDPGGRREICVQHSAGNYRIKYSANAKFSGGSPAATQTPLATDEQVMIGAGTNAAPTYAALLGTGGTAVRYHVVAQSTPVSGVYYLGMFTTVTGGATQAAGTFILEPMAAGSFDPTDTDPCVIYCSSSGGFGGSAMFGWLSYGTAGQVWLAVMTASVGPFSGSLGVDLGSGGDINGRPWFSATSGGAVRIKGVGAFVAAKGPARTYPATMNTATDAYVYLGSWAYPYPNNTVPSVS